MNLHTLKPAKGSVKTKKRVGRGQGSGRGGTSTRGHKGAKSRSGYSRKLGFEGGQMPLQRRVPKFGFKNKGRVEFKPVNLDDIQKLVDKTGATTIDHELISKNGLASKNDKIKLLGRGNLTTKVEVHLHAFSKTAIEAVESLGGKTNIV